MGYIVKELVVIGNKGKMRVRAMFDTGAGYSLIRNKIAEKLSSFVSVPSPMEFILGDGENKLLIKEKIILDIEINGCKISDEVLVAEKLSEEMIIGAKTMQAWRMKLDLENDEVIIDPKVTELKLV